MGTKLAVVAIVVEKEEAVDLLNQLLHQYSQFIIGRMGIPYPKRNISLISVAIDAPVNDINSLSGKLGKIDGITSKVAYSKIEEKA